jgi:hypothetical protein
MKNLAGSMYHRYKRMSLDDQLKALDQVARGAKGKPLDELTEEEELEVASFFSLLVAPPPGLFGDNKVFHCSRCKAQVPLTHFLKSPKCWKAIQRKLKRRYDKLPPEEQFKVWPSIGEKRPEWGPCKMDCELCGGAIYWVGWWPCKKYHCPKCYPESLRVQRNHRDRSRHGWRADKFEVIQCGAVNVRVNIRKPCDQCGEDFSGKRTDAKFCSDKCRVAAHRAKSEKVKATKKRRPRKAK